MEVQSSKAARTRQFIISVTAEIFNIKGYAGTSMSDITEATGLTKGSIYGNFENKEAVALAVFDFNYATILTAIEQEIAKAITYHDKLMVYAQVYDQLTRSTAFVKGGCPILNTAIEADDTNPMLKDRAAKAVLNWKNTLILLMAQGAAAGEFKAGMNFEQQALSIMALIEGGVMIAKVTDSPSYLYQVMSTVELLITQMKA